MNTTNSVETKHEINPEQTTETQETPNTMHEQESPKEKNDSNIIESLKPEDPTNYKMLRGRKHPLYQTSNSVYGSKKPTKVNQHLVYHGIKGTFTKTFVGGMYRNHSLNCNRTRSLVLPDPTFGTNDYFQDTF